MKSNIFIRTRKDSVSSYHLTQREPPLPVYLGLMIYNKTQDLSLMEKLLKLDLCISKHQMFQLSVSMGSTVTKANE